MTQSHTMKAPRVRDWPRLLVNLAAAALFFAIFMRIYPLGCDLTIHAGIASEFDFTDLHSITSRLAYPLWHIITSSLFQLGVPLDIAAPLVSTLFKVMELYLVQLLLTHYAGDKCPRMAVTLCAFAAVMATGISIPNVFNHRVYAGVGSPNTWHNPTQITVIALSLLLVPFAARCHGEFEKRRLEIGDKATLPWRMAALLSLLGMLSLSAKPTFMQAFLPAAATVFLIEWIRTPKCFRYFLQLILIFLPSAAYFLLQYLYYTGVVVPFTSGVTFGVTAESALATLKNALIMSVFPLFVLIFGFRRGMFRDKNIAIAALMMAFSMLEAMSFRETGMRADHGNFNWALMSSAFFFMIVMLGRYLAMASDALRAEKRTAGGLLFTAVGGMLFLWHFLSGIFYLNFLYVSGNAF